MPPTFLCDVTTRLEVRVRGDRGGRGTVLRRLGDWDLIREGLAAWPKQVPGRGGHQKIPGRAPDSLRNVIFTF